MVTVGYYCNNTIPSIEKFENNYGGHLDSLNCSEKLAIVLRLIQNVNAEIGGSGGNIRSEIAMWKQLFSQTLDAGEKIKLAVAILENTQIPTSTEFLQQRKVIDWFKDIYCQELEERAQDTVTMGWLDKSGEIAKEIWDDFTSLPKLVAYCAPPFIDEDSINWNAIGVFLIDYYNLKVYEEEEEEYGIL